jgi:hypothetical protein
MASALTKDQNQRLREILRDAQRREFHSNQTDLAKALGVEQPYLSNFLSENRGTSYWFVERVAKLTGRPEWDILGKPPPVGAAPADLADELAERLLKQATFAHLPAREVAAHFVRQILPRGDARTEAAIAEVCAEPLTPETENWPMLWWADQMRTRYLERVTAAGGAPRRHRRPRSP